MEENEFSQKLNSYSTNNNQLTANHQNSMQSDNKEINSSEDINKITQLKQKKDEKNNKDNLDIKSNFNNSHQSIGIAQNNNNNKSNKDENDYDNTSIEDIENKSCSNKTKSLIEDFPSKFLGVDINIENPSYVGNIKILLYYKNHPLLTIGPDCKLIPFILFLL